MYGKQSHRTMGRFLFIYNILITDSLIKKTKFCTSNGKTREVKIRPENIIGTYIDEPCGEMYQVTGEKYCKPNYNLQGVNLL